MIKELEGHISDQEIQAIVSIIKAQYRRYLSFMDSNQMQRLFRYEYAPHKRQHTVSWAISSAFPSGSNVLPGFQISCLKYGKGHTRPELTNNRVLLHILNQSTDFDAAYLKHYYQINTNIAEQEQVYCFIRFSVRKNMLKSVELCLPAQNGTIAKTETLLSTQELELLTA